MRRHVPVVLAALAVTASVRAEEREELVTLELTSGEKVEGVLLGLSERVYRIRVGDRVREIQERDVRRLHFSPPAEVASTTSTTGNLAQRILARAKVGDWVVLSGSSSMALMGQCSAVVEYRVMRVQEDTVEARIQLTTTERPEPIDRVVILQRGERLDLDDFLLELSPFATMNMSVKTTETSALTARALGKKLKLVRVSGVHTGNAPGLKKWQRALSISDDVPGLGVYSLEESFETDMGPIEVNITLGGYGSGTETFAGSTFAELLQTVRTPRVEGNEKSAIGALKTLAASEAIFREGDKDGNGVEDYGTLEQLTQTRLLDSVLGSGKKQGYTFVCRPGKDKCSTWYATASPEKPGVTGRRYFFTNHVGVVYCDTKPFAVNEETCEVPAGLKRAD